MQVILPAEVCEPRTGSASNLLSHGMFRRDVNSAHAVANAGAASDSIAKDSKYESSPILMVRHFGSHFFVEGGGGKALRLGWLRTVLMPHLREVVEKT
jgi:hypothetical protein